MKLILGTDFPPHAQHVGQVAVGLVHRLEDSLFVARRRRPVVIVRPTSG